MKKIFLTIGLMLSANAWADMDGICVNAIDNKEGYLEYLEMKYIAENCERNNILILSGIQKDETTLAIANYCRYDRHVRVEPYGDGQ